MQFYSKLKGKIFFTQNWCNITLINKFIPHWFYYSSQIAST
jgi:hypothetical protein